VVFLAVAGRCKIFSEWLRPFNALTPRRKNLQRSAARFDLPQRLESINQTVFSRSSLELMIVRPLNLFRTKERPDADELIINHSSAK